MAKQHSTLIGADLHNPKGIGSENTDKILHLSQSSELVNVSGSILPNNHDSFTIGQPAKRFSTGSFGIINVGGGEFTSASLAAGGSGGSSFTAAGISGSLGANATLIRSLTAVGISGSSVGGPTASDISGSWQSALSSSLYLTQVGNTISGSANASAISGSLGTNASLIRSLTALGISGSFTPISSSISTRLTTEEANIDVIQGQVNQNLTTTSSPIFGGLTVQGKLTAETYAVSSSVTHMTRSFSSGSTIFGDSVDDKHEFTGSIQIDGGTISPASISGSFTPISQSLSTRTTNLEGNPVYSSQTISGSANASAISGSLGENATLIRGLTATKISGSANASAISGSLGENASIIRTLTAAVISGSFSLSRLDESGIISGSFQLPAGIISGSTQLPVGIVSGSNQLPSNIVSGSIQLSRDTFGNISGSKTSTGSLGSLIVDGKSIDFSNLPTSDPGVAGRLYNDGGTVKISAG